MHELVGRIFVVPSDAQQGGLSSCTYKVCGALGTHRAFPLMICEYVEGMLHPWGTGVWSRESCGLLWAGAWFLRGSRGASRGPGRRSRGWHTTVFKSIAFFDHVAVAHPVARSMWYLRDLALVLPGLAWILVLDPPWPRFVSS